MKKTLLLLMAISVLCSAPVFAAKIQSTAITHLEQVYQATPGNSEGNSSEFLGYNGLGSDVITSVPGVLCIDPQADGATPWANFIGAAQGTAPVAYTIKNTTFVKQAPQYIQCADVFPAHTVTQQGTPNIRLCWPLMYELPSTTFTLTILYGTPVLYDDDGPGPNPPAWAHVEQWVWHVDVDLPHLHDILELFHELPFGKDEVPLISDEPLYTALQAKIAAAIVAADLGDTTTVGAILTDFELEVMDACIGTSPAFPNPTGPGTGIANTDENPACCKLLVDVEYIFQTSGFGQPNKK